MAGAGYDIGLAASDAKAAGLQASAPTFISFGSSRIDGGLTSLGQKLGADATATTKSPGAVNSKQEETDLTSLLPGQSQSHSSQALIIGVAAIAALFLITRK